MELLRKFENEIEKHKGYIYDLEKKLYSNIYILRIFDNQGCALFEDGSMDLGELIELGLEAL